MRNHNTNNSFSDEKLDQMFSDSDEETGNQKIRRKPSQEDQNIEEFINSQNETPTKVQAKDKVAECQKNRQVRYDIILGTGSFKKVQKGFDQEEGIEVAWCDVDISFMSASNKQRVRNEFQLWKNIKSDGIVELLDCWFDKHVSKVVFITEMFDGGNLKTFLQDRGAQRISTVKKWFKTILVAIGYLHSEGVSHRDIKSENIQINRSGAVKLGDFGLASQKINETLVGTPLYMAPEILRLTQTIQQMSGEEFDHYTAKCDIWSQGIMLLEILTNKPPQGDHVNLCELLNNKTDRIKLPELLFQIDDQESFKFICKCLCPNPDLRPDTTQLLQSGQFDSRDKDKHSLSSEMQIQLYKDVINIWKDCCQQDAPKELKEFYDEEDKKQQHKTQQKANKNDFKLEFVKNISKDKEKKSDIEMKQQYENSNQSTIKNNTKTNTKKDDLLEPNQNVIGSVIQDKGESKIKESNDHSVFNSFYSVINNESKSKSLNDQNENNNSPTKQYQNTNKVIENKPILMGFNKKLSKSRPSWKADENQFEYVHICYNCDKEKSKKITKMKTQETLTTGSAIKKTELKMNSLQLGSINQESTDDSQNLGQFDQFETHSTKTQFTLRSHQSQSLNDFHHNFHDTFSENGIDISDQFDRDHFVYQDDSSANSQMQKSTFHNMKAIHEYLGLNFDIELCTAMLYQESPNQSHHNCGSLNNSTQSQTNQRHSSEKKIIDIANVKEEDMSLITEQPQANVYSKILLDFQDQNNEKVQGASAQDEMKAISFPLSIDTMKGEDNKRCTFLLTQRLNVLCRSERVFNGVNWESDQVKLWKEFHKKKSVKDKFKGNGKIIFREDWQYILELYKIRLAELNEQEKLASCEQGLKVVNTPHRNSSAMSCKVEDTQSNLNHAHINPKPNEHQHKYHGDINIIDKEKLVDHDLATNRSFNLNQQQSKSQENLVQAEHNSYLSPNAFKKQQRNSVSFNNEIQGNNRGFHANSIEKEHKE